MKQITYKSLKFQRHFGLEIELSKSLAKRSVVEAIENCSNYKVHSSYYRRSVDNKIWHVKSDMTCGDDEDDPSGWEVASFVGRGPHDIIHMGEVATAIKEAGAKVNHNCGLHIHAEAIDFTPSDVGILLAYWVKVEHIIRHLIASYRNFEYCWPLENTLEGVLGPRFRGNTYDPEEIYRCFLPSGNDNPWEYRYYAINIINYYLCSKDRRRKRKTLELRFPESTLEVNDVIGWLRLYLNFIEYVKTAPMPTTLYQSNLETTMIYLGLHHDNDNFYLFGPSLNKTRVWFLSKLIRNLENSNEPNKIFLRRDAKRLLKTIKI